MKEVNLDGTDLRILAELVENSKQSYVEIGRKLALHPNVIAYRVNRLEDAHIIR
jgi:DNA-binding Lrp family transcriptional regulator